MNLAGEWVYWLPEPSSWKISTAWSDGPNVIRRSRAGRKRLYFGQNSKSTSTKWQRFAWKATLPKDLKASVWMVTVSQSCKTFNLKLNAILGIVEKSLLSRMLGEIALIRSNRVTPLSPVRGVGGSFIYENLFVVHCECHVWLTSESVILGKITVLDNKLMGIF